MAIVDMVLSGSKNAEVKKTYQEIVKENLDTAGFKYIQTPMSVVVEGELEGIMAMVKKIQEEIADAGYGRVFSILRIDDRRDKKGTMEQKLNSVRTKTEKM